MTSRSSQVELLVASLQVKGMRSILVERGLGFGGKNSLMVRSNSRDAGSRLIEHIPELAQHRLLVDDDDEGDAIVINLV